MPSVRVGDSPVGQAVFAQQAFTAGQEIMEFTGELFERSHLPPVIKPEDDRYIQIDVDHYFGPSGNYDDLVNHSCNPNAGIRIHAQRVALIAIRDIAPGEEITWDYSTTMYQDSWQMHCACGQSVCRKIIGNFHDIPLATQEKYIQQNIVPDYILATRKERA